MKIAELIPGDILLFREGQHSPLVAKGIRFITGSEYYHCGIMVPHQGTLQLLEQGFRREIHPIELLEDIQVVRPKFPIDLDPKEISEGTFYGFTCIIDALVNHGLSRIGDYSKLFSWSYLPMLSSLWGFDCSALVAEVLRLKEYTSWCEHSKVCEPDDFWNHIETFQRLGQLTL
jgi:hypothetical protein